jgi:cytochrome c553
MFVRAGVALVLACLLISIGAVEAKRARLTAFLGVYPGAVDTQLDNLPSSSGHCGVCHLDFDGGGPLNPYGLDVDVGVQGGLSDEEAILAIEGDDSDADGYTNIIEITDTLNFDNCPTFPGLAEHNKNSTTHIPVEEIEPYLYPTSQSDTIPPVVVITSPNGGETMTAHNYFAITYSATDASGISHINVYLSDNSGSSFMPMALNKAPGTGFSWFIPNLPGIFNRIAVEAVDNAGNAASDMSDANFTILRVPPGYVPWTLRDNVMSGTQPLEGAVMDDPDAVCATCHGNFDTAHEPWFNWRGGAMAQAARDPLFFACMAIAEQDAPGVGDICIRCHSPGGFQEGRAFDTSGGMLNAKDRHGVHCDYCHRAVDHIYVPGVSPPEDEAVLAGVNPLPLQYGNGQFINDPAPLRRGPYGDSHSVHAYAESPFHRSSDVCGVCHDVSNPSFINTGPGDYLIDMFDRKHPDMAIRNMFPVERTYSEWSASEYAAVGVYAPQFAGNKADGIVSTCQDCHMHDVNARGANDPGLETRPDLPLHDMTGGNTFLPDIVPTYYPDEVDVAQLQAAKARALSMLEKAATLEVTPGEAGITVRVTNETGHKLPSGYPEGRRIWLNVKALDGFGQMVFESGGYDFGTAELLHDDQEKIYECHLGLSPALASMVGLTPGKSFHFVLCDTVYKDNRIPPRGFTNAAFEAVQSPPVDYAYADGQYWDDTQYTLPVEAESVVVTLYYQTTTREYVEFLRDENITTQDGQNLYNSWVAQGKSAPVVMAQASVDLSAAGVSGGSGNRQSYSLSQNYPNPFTAGTAIAYSLADRVHVSISIYDLGGRHIRTLVNEVQEPSRYRVTWDGTDDGGRALPSGIYFIRYSAGDYVFSRKVTLLR